MDAESLAQIEQIVSSTEGRLRTEIATAVSSPGDRLRTEMQTLREELGEKFEEAKRHRDALFEELCRKLDLVIESQRGLHEDMDRLEASIGRKSTETQALVRSMMGQSNPQSKTQSRTNLP